MAIQPNPDKPLRTAYIAALKTATGLDIWVKNVPKSAVIANQYILIATQTKNRTAIAKADINLSDNFDWLCSIEFQLVNISLSGFANPGANDDLEQLVIEVTENILVPGWAVKSRDLLQETNLDLQTPESFIERKIITYTHWVAKLV